MIDFPFMIQEQLIISLFAKFMGGPFLFSLGRSQPLFYFIPLEMGLIRRPPWGWKNLGDSIFQSEKAYKSTKKPNIDGLVCQGLM